jgi:hypothetical protein
MYTLKKFAGIIFLLVAVLFGLYFLIRIPKIVGIVLATGGNYSIGYRAGTVVYWLFLGGLICILIRYGLKWLKNPHARPVSTILDEDLRNPESGR